jgi:S1-C subfamily serine protease
MGWTLAQCRQHFGHEIDAGYTSLIADADSGLRTFGLKYRHYTREENLAKDAPAFHFDGILVRVKLDLDGTVGRIQFEKSGVFSDQEIKQLLKSASAVSWSPVPGSRKSDWVEEEQQRPTLWVGEYKGVILFDAEETFDYFDCGHNFLTVTTRQQAGHVDDQQRRAIVMITVQLAKDPTRSEQGTGFFIDDRTLVTSYHLIRRTGDIGTVKCQLYDGSIVQVNKLLAYSKECDVAALQLPAHSAKYALQLCPNSDVYRKGAVLTVAGFPDSKFAAIEGSIKEVYDSDNTTHKKEVFYADLPLTGGFSGSPVLDQRGRVLGIIWGTQKETAIIISANVIWEALKLTNPKVHPNGFLTGVTKDFDIRTTPEKACDEGYDYLDLIEAARAPER